MAKRKPKMTVDEVAAKGGRARAKKLSPDQRAEIARNAADTRWNIPKATHDGVVDVGGFQVEAAVLEDGRRVLARQSFLAAIGRKGQPKAAERGADGQFFDTPAFLDAENLKPFIGEDLSRTSRPIVYRTKKGGRGYGYEARMLPLVCEVYLAAREAGVLSHTQLHVAKACEILVRGLAQTGIVALVDEATGFQEVRDKKALQAILDQYLRHEFAAWAKRFPDDFYKEMFRLKGWAWDNLNPAGGPRCVGNYTKDVVYARLAPELLKELEGRNPVGDNGRRKAAHHQWLTDEIGHPALSQHLHAVMGLMRASPNWEFFLEMLDRSFPKKGHGFQLTIEDLSPKADAIE